MLEGAAEEVSGGGEGFGGVGGALGPAGDGFEVFEGIVGGVFFDLEETDLGVGGGGDLFGGVFDGGCDVEAGEGHLHVGLAGG